jgi:hypothetical protein
MDQSELLLEEINGGVDFFIILLSYILIFWTIAILPFLENLVSLKSLLFYSWNINFFWVFRNLSVVFLYMEII